MNTILRLSNFLVLPFWALMIVLPRWRWTKRVMKSPLVSLGPALIYGTLVVPRLPAIWPVVSRPTVEGIAQLLASPAAATIAWAHFLAFDLFVARWIYLDSRERRMSPVWISPVLFLTLMLGPLGFLSYLCVRLFAQKSRAALRLPIGHWLRNGFSINRPLMVLGCVMLLTLLGTVIGLVFDTRVITGAPAWLKPAKFSISVSVYCFTLVWLVGFLKNRGRIVQIATRAIVFSVAVEMIVIIAQAIRGTTSHFNMSTPFNTFLWITMGAFITVVWVMTFALTVALIRQAGSDRAFAWSLRWGLIISLLGMATGFLMVRPTPEQRAAVREGHPTIVGAHTIGVSDGGPGLPVVGWSTVGGDMRVAHFVGLHGLQIVPFLGWLITRRRRHTRLNEGHRVALIWIAGLTYSSIVILLVWQALRGESVIHPDASITSVAGAMFSISAIATASVFQRALGTPRAGRSNKIKLGAMTPLPSEREG